MPSFSEFPRGCRIQEFIIFPYTLLTRDIFVLMSDVFTGGKKSHRQYYSWWDWDVYQQYCNHKSEDFLRKYKTFVTYRREKQRQSCKLWLAGTDLCGSLHVTRQGLPSLSSSTSCLLSNCTPEMTVVETQLVGLVISQCQGKVVRLTLSVERLLVVIAGQFVETSPRPCLVRQGRKPGCGCQLLVRGDMIIMSHTAAACRAPQPFSIIIMLFFRQNF